MVLLLLIVGAVAARLLLARFHEAPNTRAARTFGRQLGVQPSGPDGRYTRRDRLLAAAASVGGACAGFAVAVAGFGVADRFPNLSTTNHVFSGVGFVGGIVGALALLAGVVHLLAAPFARGRIPARAGSSMAVDRDREV